jgi:hypothetical protein
MDTSTDTHNDTGRLLVGTRVEVHTRYEPGRWVPGFTIAEVRGDGYLIRRTSDGSVLTETLDREEVRIASSGPHRPWAPKCSQSAVLEPRRRSAARRRVGADQ